MRARLSIMWWMPSGSVLCRAALASAVAAALAVPASAAQTLAGKGAVAAEEETADPALEDFQKRLQAYLDLREALSDKVKPLSPTPDSVELTARQEALAAAMKSARKSARQGDLVPAPIARRIAATVAEDRKRRAPAAKSATLEEVPALPRPAINRTYPPDVALPTVPPLLLAQLPKLPDNLQYRFYGRHVVLLDGDLQIIVDYVSNVLPPQ